MEGITVSTIRQLVCVTAIYICTKNATKSNITDSEKDYSWREE